MSYAKEKEDNYAERGIIPASLETTLHFSFAFAGRRYIHPHSELQTSNGHEGKML
jgi:hypothetical protein